MVYCVIEKTPATKDIERIDPQFFCGTNWKECRYNHNTLLVKKVYTFGLFRKK